MVPGIARAVAPAATGTWQPHCGRAPGMMSTTNALKGAHMITAIVMIDTEADVIPEVAEKIANIEGISEVYSVTGGVDLVAIARVDRHEERSEEHTSELQSRGHLVCRLLLEKKKSK